MYIKQLFISLVLPLYILQVYDFICTLVAFGLNEQLLLIVWTFLNIGLLWCNAVIYYDCLMVLWHVTHITKLPQVDILNVGLCTFSILRCYPYIILKVRLGPCCQYPLYNLEMTPEWGPHQGWDTILQWGIIRQENDAFNTCAIWYTNKSNGVKKKLHQILHSLSLYIFNKLLKSLGGKLGWCSRI